MFSKTENCFQKLKIIKVMHVENSH